MLYPANFFALLLSSMLSADNTTFALIIILLRNCEAYEFKIMLTV